MLSYTYFVKKTSILSKPHYNMAKKDNMMPFFSRFFIFQKLKNNSQGPKIDSHIGFVHPIVERSWTLSSLVTNTSDMAEKQYSSVNIFTTLWVSVTLPNRH